MSRHFNETHLAPNEDVLKTPASAAYNNLNTISLAAWIFPIAISPKGGPPVSSILSKDPSVSLAWEFDIRNDLTFAPNNLSASRTLSVQGAQAVSIANTITLNLWQHVVFTIDTTPVTGDFTPRLYLNGTEVSYAVQSVGIGTIPDDSGDGIWIGSDGFNNNFGGNIGEVRIYNVVLTLAQISALYNGGTNPPGNPVPANLVGYWRLCGAPIAGPEADYSGNGNNATVQNAIAGPDTPAQTCCAVVPMTSVFIARR